MSKTPHSPVPDDTTQAKVWIKNELLAFVDQIAERDERSRAFVVNQALASWKCKLEGDRKRRPRKS